MTSVLYQHADLYVFAHVYLIKDLAELAFKNVTSLIESQTESKESNDAIIDVIKLICSEVNHEDPSIEWFAKYVAWKIVDLRGHKSHKGYKIRPAGVSASLGLVVPNQIHREFMSMWLAYDEVDLSMVLSVVVA
ncbi:hypothetical protein MMC25_001639 [Agyrium rufum]|nr:hypothetical protein [Agyrium rufum]